MNGNLSRTGAKFSSRHAPLHTPTSHPRIPTAPILHFIILRVHTYIHTHILEAWKNISFYLSGKGFQKSISKNSGSSPNLLSTLSSHVVPNSHSLLWAKVKLLKAAGAAATLKNCSFVHWTSKHWSSYSGHLLPCSSPSVGISFSLSLKTLGKGTFKALGICLYLSIICTWIHR